MLKVSPWCVLFLMVCFITGLGTTGAPLQGNTTSSEALRHAIEVYSKNPKDAAARENLRSIAQKVGKELRHPVTFRAQLKNESGKLSIVLNPAIMNNKEVSAAWLVYALSRIKWRNKHKKSAEDRESMEEGLQGLEDMLRVWDELRQKQPGLQHPEMSLLKDLKQRQLLGALLYVERFDPAPDAGFVSWGEDHRDFVNRYVEQVLLVAHGGPASTGTEAFRTPAAEDALSEARRLDVQGRELYRGGRLAKTLPLAERSLAIREKILGPDHLELIVSLDNLAALHRALGNFGQAEELLQRSLRIREKSLGPNHAEVGDALNNLGYLLFLAGAAMRAQPLFERSVSILERTRGLDHESLLTPLNNLAVTYQNMGDYDRAEALYQRSMTLSQNVKGSRDPGVTATLNNLAELYRLKRDYGRAEELHLRRIAELEKTFGPNHPRVGQALHSLGKVYQSKGDSIRAEALYLRSISIYEKASGPVDAEIAKPLASLATLYESRADYARAEALILRSLSITEKALGPEHPDVASGLRAMGQLYATMAQYQRVEPLYMRALAINEKALGKDHPKLGIAQVWITGGSHLTQGTVKLNDTYFNTPTYNSTAWRNLVSCQEVGHTLGLDHQDENFNNANLVRAWITRTTHRRISTLTNMTMISC